MPSTEVAARAPVTVVLPTLNEALNIARLIAAILARVAEAEVGVVDDDSPDGTWRIVQEIAAADPRVRLLRRIGRRGLTSAIQEGIDADIVGDVHRLSEIVGAETYDVVISCSSFEHFKYPQLAAHEIMKTLKVGGLLFIQTHQSYPIHGVPNDYYRFSRDALAALFGTKMGFDVIATDYEFPVRIFTPETPSALMKAYMNTRLFGEKLAPTPEEYLYEL